MSSAPAHWDVLTALRRLDHPGERLRPGSRRWRSSCTSNAGPSHDREDVVVAGMAEKVHLDAYVAVE